MISGVGVANGFGQKTAFGWRLMLVAWRPFYLDSFKARARPPPITACRCRESDPRRLHICLQAKAKSVLKHWLDLENSAESPCQRVRAVVKAGNPAPERFHCSADHRFHHS